MTDSLTLNEKLYKVVKEYSCESVLQEVNSLYSFENFVNNSTTAILQSLANEGLLEEVLKKAYGEEYSKSIYERHVQFYTISFESKESQDLDELNSKYTQVGIDDLTLDYPKDFQDVTNCITLIKDAVTKNWMHPTLGAKTLEEKIKQEVLSFLFHGLKQLSADCTGFEIINIISEYIDLNSHYNDRFLQLLVKSNFCWDKSSIVILNSNSKKTVFSNGNINLQSFYETDAINEIDWHALSSNTRINWSENFIDQHIDLLDFTKLCTNPAINWDFRLIKKYERRVVWNVNRDLTSSMNYYYKFAKERANSCGGLIYNKKMIWTSEIIENFSKHIDIFEISLNGELTESAVWSYRNELLEEKLYDHYRSGPRDDKEWVEIYKSGFENLLSERRTFHLSNRILNFMALNDILHHLCCDSWEYYTSQSSVGISWLTELTFSEIDLTNILMGQYSWVPRLMNTRMNPPSFACGKQNQKYLINPSFWNNCLRDIFLDNITLLSASLRKSIEQSKEFQIESNSILIDLNEFTISSTPIYPRFYKVISDYAEYIKVQELKITEGIIKSSDHIVILTKDDTKKIKPTDFNCFSRYQCHIRFPSSYLEQKNDHTISETIFFYFRYNKDVFDLLNNLET